MSETKQGPGRIGWVDLTVPNAGKLQEFYKQVVGWNSTEFNMGEYSDYVVGPGEDMVAGICHPKGANAAIPPVWLIYISVDNLELSMAKCLELGGTILIERRSAGAHGSFCVIRDPEGVVSALFEPLKPAA